MSHAWIRGKRLTKSVGKNLAEEIRKKGYSRHVFLFSIPHAVAHSEALILCSGGKRIDSKIHDEHELTRHWKDNEIQRIVNDRAGLDFESRHKNKG